MPRARSQRATRHRILFGVTGLGVIGFLTLGGWAFLWPERSGTGFQLWPQILRVGSVLFGTVAVVGVMLLALPHVMNRLEGRGFVSMLAARHVRAGKSGFLTAMSVLSIMGVALSALALCAVISVIGGFGQDLKAKILGNNAHVLVDSSGPAGIKDWRPILDAVTALPGVVGATAVAAEQAIASSSMSTSGVIVRGVQPELIGAVIDLKKNIEAGRFEYLAEPERLKNLPADLPLGRGTHGETYLMPPRGSVGEDSAALDPEGAPPPDGVPEPGIIIGRELSRTLGVLVGDEVSLVAPLGDLGPMGVMPRRRTFRVAAIFYSGMYEYDAQYVYTTLPSAQRFFDLDDAATAIDVRVENPDRVDAVRERIAATVGPGLRVRDWKELNRNLFAAIKLEKIAAFIILALAVVVASFCIVCTLLLMVTEKSKEIAILKALGATDGSILRVFMTEGIIIGAIGAVFGVAMGLASCLGLERFGVRIDPDVYYVDRLPIHVDPVDYLLVIVAAIAITTLATLYPAITASRLRPVDGLRHE